MKKKKKPIGCNKSRSKMEVYKIQSYLREQEKSQINNLTLHLKQLQKEQQTKPKVSTRKEIIKIRAEINAREMKKTMEKINETKSWFFEKIKLTNLQAGS